MAEWKAEVVVRLLPNHMQPYERGMPQGTTISIQTVPGTPR